MRSFVTIYLFFASHALGRNGGYMICDTDQCYRDFFGEVLATQMEELLVTDACGVDAVKLEFEPRLFEWLNLRTPKKRESIARILNFVGKEKIKRCFSEAEDSTQMLGVLAKELNAIGERPALEFLSQDPDRKELDSRNIKLTLMDEDC